MTATKQPALTTQEAFEKYFGKVTELNKKTYPYPCICGNYSVMHLEQDWVGHIKDAHKERVFSQKQIDSYKRRAEERQKEKEGLNKVVNVITEGFQN